MAGGILSDLEKAEDSDNLTTANNKEELVTFLCMMQSNAEFIPEFSKKAALSKETNQKGYCGFYCWRSKENML